MAEDSSFADALPANVLLVERRAEQLSVLAHRLTSLGYSPHAVFSLESLVPIAIETRAEVALLHLNFVEGGGGIVAGYFLREARKDIRILAFSGSSTSAGLSVARALGLADRVAGTTWLEGHMHEVLPHLVRGARADRAATEALSHAAPQVPDTPAHPRPIDLGAPHDTLDKSVIQQLLCWLGGVRPVARALRMQPASLRWRMQKLGIDWHRDVTLPADLNKRSG